MPNLHHFYGFFQASQHFSIRVVQRKVETKEKADNVEMEPQIAPGQLITHYAPNIPAFILKLVRKCHGYVSCLCVQPCSYVLLYCLQ